MPYVTIGALRQRPIPGGWSQQRVHCGEHCWDLLLPTDADQFLQQLDPQTPTGDEPDVYWSRLWPTAVTMSRLISRANWPAGAGILEIGCGIGLLGLAALASGWQVTFSDYVPIAVDLAVANAMRNGFTSARGMLLDWRRPFSERFAGIVASDVLYDPCRHPALIAILDCMLERGGTAWFGDPGRYHVEHFVELAWDRGYDIDVCDADGQSLQALTSGDFQLLQMRRRSEEPVCRAAI